MSKVNLLHLPDELINHMWQVNSATNKHQDLIEPSWFSRTKMLYIFSTIVHCKYNVIYILQE